MLALGITLENTQIMVDLTEPSAKIWWLIKINTNTQRPPSLSCLLEYCMSSLRSTVQDLFMFESHEVITVPKT